MPMSAVSHSYLESLRSKHAALSEEIESAQRCLSADDFSLVQMKKQKLLVKEKLTRFAAQGSETEQ